MSRFSHTILTLTLLAMTVAAGAENLYGLRFRSHEFRGKDRTTLFLNEGVPISVGQQLDLRFRIAFRDLPVFGNVLSLCTDNGLVIDLKIALADDETFRPTLILGDDAYPLAMPLKGRNPIDDMQAIVTLDRRKNAITFSFANHQRTISAPLSDVKTVAISFGNQFYKGGSGDVAPIDIWNVRVDRDNSPIYDWELRTHTDSTSTDRLAGAKAVAVNGHWLRDDHTKWAHVLSATGRHTQYAFRQQTGIFYIASDDSLVTWNAATGETTALPVTGRRPASSPYSLYANERRGTLHAYCLETGRVDSLNLKTLKWQSDEPTLDDNQYLDHGYASNGGDTLYAFGGYGHYRYSNKLFRICTNTGQALQADYSPSIEPRVNIALAQIDQRLYIFGGYGNKSGKQEMQREFFNDLWEIDLNTMKARRLWKAESKEQFTVAAKMIYDADQDCFYTVDGKQRLLKISRQKPQWQVVSEPVSFSFDCLHVDYDIFISEALQRLYLVVNKTMDDLNYTTDIFSIDLPIPDDALTAQEQPVDTEEDNRSWLLWLVIALAALLAAIAAARHLRSRRQAKEHLEPQQPSQPAPAMPEVPAASASAVGHATPEKDTDSADNQHPSPITQHPLYYDRHQSHIQMLGEFRVLDSQGADITNSITRRTRDLFIIILLSSVAKKKGIETRTLDDLFWQGMDSEAARNNRNVYIRKTRLLMGEVGQVEISNDKFYCKAEIGPDVLFDYREAVRLMDQMESQPSPELSARTLELLMRGPLLPAMSTEWLDDLKGDYTARAIRLFHRLERQALADSNLDQAYSIAEAIMRHDPFSEEALRTQCNILTQKKTVGIAKSVYDRFCKTYEQAMGEPYAVSFADVCKGR